MPVTHFKIQSGIFKSWLPLPIMALAMLACGHLGDRTTVVYGRVFDENHMPVDSIQVLLSGSNLRGVVSLKSTYTDENGDYEILLEVPRKFADIDVNIPYGLDNPKYEREYSQANDIKGQKSPMVGKKTQKDFQLEPK